ncbi:PAS domain S-box protein [Microvirga sp. HBU67558]|uniref:sensor histidine kinase n=1 Tax=Microvirga TaxID=186650 RepID=UPI001B37CD24|nr:MULTISPECIES: PAS domain S-box protein [unclassified Microvirga]MBQ0819499.1 PAS domain S-box protein [Microvirga sp. HBU67558]
MDNQLEILLRRQKVLADFGDFALQSEDLDEVLTEACRLVGEAMDTGRAKVLEIARDGDSLLVRAGVGWARDIVGQVRLPMNERSSETYSIRKRKPVITQDIRTEERFDVPEFMKQAGVVALANVPILLPGGHAYGLLQVDDTKPREFNQNDTEFLRTYATILGPIIDRLFKLRDLRSSEERFRLTVEAATDYAILTTDPDDCITDWLPGAAVVYGWSTDEAIGQPGSMLFTPEDRAAGVDRKEVETARQEGVAPNVRWHLRKDGSRVFIEGSVRALRDNNGAVTGFLKIGQDVTERRAFLDQQQVLLAELQHRTRNLMAVVRRIADRTLRSSTSLEDFGPTFHDRIAALARVQGLLSRLNPDERVTFDQLVTSELVAHGGFDQQADKVTLKGPQGVALRSSTVQTLALALHELCTNALKYGALHQPEGHLSIHWQLRQEDGQPWLYVDWRESGVVMPSDGTTPDGGGAGRELIERALPYQLNARTSFILEADGVHCTMALPVSEKGTAEESADG